MNSDQRPDVPVLRNLAAFRSSLRRTLVIERASVGLAAAVTALLLACGIDFLLRMPSMVRAAELVAGAAAIASWCWLRMLPALRFRPSLVELALRIERGDGAASGRLAVAVDLMANASGAPQRLVSLAVDRADHLPPPDPARIDRRPMRRALAAAAAALLAAIGTSIAFPDAVRTGLLRIATPFSGVQWPARTMVEPAMAGDLHPRGVALPLRARTLRGDPASMRVGASYRIIRGGSGQWVDVALAAQPGGTFERLVDSDGESVEVVFRTDDMETEPVTVRLEPAPAVREAFVRIDPPEYLVGTVDARTAALGDGTDRRAVLSPPVIAGSFVTLTLRTEGTTEPPADPVDLRAWVARTAKIADLGGEAIVPSLERTEGAAGDWMLRWIASGAGVVEIHPEGSGGLAPTGRIAFEIPSIEDAPPTVAIVEPVSDEAVTPDAEPTVVGEARDDLGVTRAWVEVSVVRQGAEPRTVPPAGERADDGRIERRVSIKETGAAPGDRVVCVARATDAWVRGGVPREPASSSPRVFRVVAPAELSEQVRSSLGRLREAAERLRDEQGSLAGALRSLRRSPDEAARGRLAAQQGRLADRVASFERTLADLAGRLERNKVIDDALDGSIDEARSLSRAAGEDARRSAEEAAKPGGEEESSRAADSAERSLADLAAALSRDRAAAELSRRIDRLAERIDAARRETAEVGAKAMGKQRSQLPDELRARLDRAAQEQREAAEEARSLTDDLGRQAQDSERGEKSDPGVPEALREAQREAESSGLSRRLEDAARQTADNQMQAAGRSQGQAKESVERMREAMRNQRRRRTEELERRITEAVDAIRRLVAEAEERSLPVQRLGADDAAARDREAAAALRLSGNAGGVAESVAAAGTDMRRAAELVMRGSDHAGRTAQAIRAEPADLAAARDAIESSRQSFAEALAVAEKAGEDARKQAENERREELRERYAKALELQRSARAAAESALPVPGRPMDRRALLEVRRIGSEQAAVTAALGELSSRPDVSGSELYAASNHELVAASESAERDLQSAALTLGTVLAQREVEAGIAGLVEALSDPPEPDDPFAEAPRQQQAGGGGAPPPGNPRVPPIAELRLLRTMAQRVLDDTAAAAALPEADRVPYLGRVAQRQARILELGERWSAAMKQQAERERAGAAGGDMPPKEAESP